MAGGIPVSFTFRDAKNQTAAVHQFLASSLTTAQVETQLANLLPLYAALTNASVKRNQGVASLAPVAGTSAEFDDIEDKALMVFQTTTGAIHRYQIPAPKAVVFLADRETVDFSQADVAAWVTQMLIATVSQDGVALGASVGGTRLRRKQQRKFNIRTRNPALSGQGL